jgi:hypothetical protein
VWLQWRSSGEEHASAGAVASVNAGAVAAVLLGGWRSGSAQARARLRRRRGHGGWTWRDGEMESDGEKNEVETRSNRTVKGVRSAFCVMTGRGGRMTGRGGGSVRLSTIGR